MSIYGDNFDDSAEDDPEITDNVEVEDNRCVTPENYRQEIDYFCDDKSYLNYRSILVLILAVLIILANLLLIYVLTKSPKLRKKVGKYVIDRI